METAASIMMKVKRGKFPATFFSGVPVRVHGVKIPDVKSRTLVGIIRQRIRPDSLVYSDGCNSYDVLDVRLWHSASNICLNPDMWIACV